MSSESAKKKTVALTALPVPWSDIVFLVAYQLLAKCAVHARISLACLWQLPTCNAHASLAPRASQIFRSHLAMIPSQGLWLASTQGYRRVEGNVHEGRQRASFLPHHLLCCDRLRLPFTLSTMGSTSDRLISNPLRITCTTFFRGHSLQSTFHYHYQTVLSLTLSRRDLQHGFECHRSHRTLDKLDKRTYLRWHHHLNLARCVDFGLLLCSVRATSWKSFVEHFLLPSSSMEIQARKQRRFPPSTPSPSSKFQLSRHNCLALAKSWLGLAI